MTTRSAPIFYVTARKPSAPAKGAKTPPPSRVDVSYQVLSLEYTDTEKGADKLVLSISNYDYGLFDDPVFADGNVLEVSWGYPEAMTPVRECVVTKMTGGNPLKVEALGKDYLMMTERKVRTFEDMTHADVAKKIAAELGFSDEQVFVEETGTRYPKVPQGSMTDYMLLARLARKNGFVHWIDHLGFHFKKRDLLQTPLRRFTYFIDPGRGDITSPVTVENDITAKPATVTAKGVDPVTKKPIEAKADNDTTKRDGLAPILMITKTGAKGDYKKPSKPDNQTGSGVTTPTTATTQADAKKQADSAYRSVQMTAAKISFTAVGDPRMEAKRVVTCDGFSKALAGNYYVTEVKHKVGAGGYSMTVKATRDGKSSAGVAAGTTLANKTSDAAQNKQKATAGTATTDGHEQVFVPISVTGAAGQVVKFVPPGTKPAPTQSTP